MTQSSSLCASRVALILGHIYADEGSTQQARTIVEEAFAIARQIDARWLFPNLLVQLGDIAAREMDLEAASALYCEALQHTSAAANQTSMGHAVLKYAALLSARGEHRGAVRLLAALSRVGRVFEALRRAREVIVVCSFQRRLVG